MATDNLIASLIPFFGCVIRPTPEGVELTVASRNFMNAVAITFRKHGDSSRPCGDLGLNDWKDGPHE